MCPTKKNIKDLILDEDHKNAYAGPGYEKLITMPKKEYLWLGMKKDVDEFLT